MAFSIIFFSFYIAKLNPNGEYLWHTFYVSKKPEYNGAGIAIGTDSNVYVTGTVCETWQGPSGQLPLHLYQGFCDLFVLALDANGAYKWHTFYGVSDDEDAGDHLEMDAEGNLYITGSSGKMWWGPAGQEPLHPHRADDSNGILVLKLSTSNI